MGKSPPGFRFHPTDEELLKYYLKRKVLGKKLHFNGIAEVEINKFPPWDLPDKSYMKSGDRKWYFFTPKGKKFGSGNRFTRSTEYGYWKVTGRDRPVHNSNELVGMIKTLVFHEGKAPKGDRTDWVMHEYRLEDKELADKGVAQDSYALCIVFHKDGVGPRNGSQYGAPFKEEDWSDDEEAVATGETSMSALALPFNQNGGGIATSMQTHSSMCIDASFFPSNGSLNVSCVDVSSANKVLHHPILENNMAVAESVQPSDDELLSFLASFLEDDSFPSGNERSKSVELDKDPGTVGAAVPGLDGYGIHNGLGDLLNMEGLSFHGHINLFGDFQVGLAPEENEQSFLELIDLDVPLEGSESALYELGNFDGQSSNEFSYGNNTYSRNSHGVNCFSGANSNRVNLSEFPAYEGPACSLTRSQ